MESLLEFMSDPKRDVEQLETARKVTGSPGLQIPRESEDAEDRRILRMIDWHLIPFVSFLYLLAFL